MDFNQHRRLKEEMIRHHIMSRGISDERVLAAFWHIERHRFVPPHLAEKSYSDAAIPIAEGQTISQPYMVALMTERLQLTGSETVLEIGTGSGFQAAVLAYLGVSVYTIERHFELLAGARKRFKEFGYKIQSMVGDGTIGWPEFAPFDRIIVTAGAPDIPQTLVQQLSDGGFMLIPVGDRKEQVLTRVFRNADEIRVEPLVNCRFVPLVGEAGWKLQEV